MNWRPLEVTVTLDAFRTQMRQMFMEYLTDSADYVDRECERAIKDFDFQGEIRRLLYPMITETLRESIKKAISNVAYDPYFLSSMEAAVRKQIIERFGEEANH